MLNWSLPSFESATTPTDRPSKTIGTTSIVPIWAYFIASSSAGRPCGFVNAPSRGGPRGGVRPHEVQGASARTDLSASARIGWG